MSNEQKLVTFAVMVGDEVAGQIHLVPEAEALVAAMKSDPKIVYVDDSVG